MTRELRIAAAELVEKALEGLTNEVEVGSFLSNLPTTTDSEILEALHAAVHFLTDADIRQKDLAYDQLCRKQLSEMYKKLKLT